MIHIFKENMNFFEKNQRKPAPVNEKNYENLTVSLLIL